MVRKGTLGDVGTIVAFNAAMSDETEGKELDREDLERGVRALIEDPTKGHYFLALREGRLGIFLLEFAADHHPDNFFTAQGRDFLRRDANPVTHDRHPIPDSIDLLQSV